MGSTRAQRAVLQFPGKPPIALPQVVSASGARYSDGYTTLWIKGPEALIESGSVNVKDCRETTTAPVRSLTGKWSLRELNGKPVPLERPPYMEFQSQGERVAGMSGCNRFSANYTAKDASLRFGMAISTQMACPGNVMAVEDAFLKAIEATASHKLEGGELSLIDASGNVLARFKAE